MTVLEDTKFIMKKYGIHPKKNLGQNFLIDEHALNVIADDVNSNDTVIEIGPGLGTLTSILLNKAKKVIVVELDSRMVEILKERFKLYTNIEIINEDILKIDIDNLSKNAKVVANLPYYITTSIITQIIKSNVKDITLLIQKEVADRICAEPGSKQAGAITYFINYYADAKILERVPKESFIPAPKVESAVVKLEKLKKPRVQVKNEEILFNLIKENFSKRRKNISNSLSNSISKGLLLKILEELNIDENQRGETLTLEQFALISNYLS